MYPRHNGPTPLKSAPQPFCLQAVVRILAVLLAALASTTPIAGASGEYSIQEIGLTGTNYSYDGNQSSQVVSPINPAGNVIGNSARYSSSGSSLGQDSWFFNGTSTQQIGLEGTNYSYAASGGTYEYSAPTWANDT